MKYSLVIFLSIVAVFSSCEHEKMIDLEEISITPQMVINGLIYANSDTSYLHITESRSIYNNANPQYKIINDAAIKFYLNNHDQGIKYSETDTAYIVTKNIKAGDKISIISSYNEKEIKSSVEMPDAPEIISIDTTHVKKIQYYGSGLKSFILFNVKIKDTPNIKDYYRLVINNNLIGDNVYYSYTDYGTYYSDDPLLSGYLTVFRDVSFDGKEYNLQFYISDYMYLVEEEGDTEYTWNLSVKLQKINEDLYKYYSSLQSNNNNDFTESQFIYSNIDGGLGILGACNEINLFENKISSVRTLKTQ